MRERDLGHFEAAEMSRNVRYAGQHRRCHRLEHGVRRGGQHSETNGLRHCSLQLRLSDRAAAVSDRQLAAVVDQHRANEKRAAAQAKNISAGKYDPVACTMKPTMIGTVIPAMLPPRFMQPPRKPDRAREAKMPGIAQYMPHQRRKNSVDAEQASRLSTDRCTIGDAEDREGTR